MFYDVYCALCEKNGLTPSGAASKIGFNRASVTVWKNTGKAPKQELLLKIADFFGVTTDYLLTGDENKKAPTLTPKDERDIERRLSEVLEELERGQDGLMFSGEAMDETTRELLAASLRNSMEIGKTLAKKKYTPKKYRKED